jgi:DNA-binding MarR family transcriptional regulator
MKEARRDVDASRVVVTLARADGALSRYVEEVLGPTGVTIPQFNVLMELASAPEGALPLSELARRLLKSPPNITSLIDRLERDGSVRRTREASDRRVVMAEITEQGWLALGRAAPAVFAAEKRLLACLSRDRRRDLKRLLETLTAEATASTSAPS